jgi:hypothetical protein
MCWTTCSECGWMKVVGAASLLETKVWAASRPRKHARREAVPYQQSPEQLVAADAARGVRRVADMAKRGAHRRQDGLLRKLQAVLVQKRRIQADVHSGLGCSCFALHIE